MDWPYSLRGAVVTLQVNFHETQADGLVMARRSASFRLALVFRGSCTSYLKIVLFSEHHFERSQNLATYRKNFFNEAHEVVICSNFFQFLILSFLKLIRNDCGSNFARRELIFVLPLIFTFMN